MKDKVMANGGTMEEEDGQSLLLKPVEEMVAEQAPVRTGYSSQMKTNCAGGLSQASTYARGTRFELVRKYKKRNVIF